MKIIHNIHETEKPQTPFEIIQGQRKANQTLNSGQKNLLDEVGSVFSVIYGGSYKGRRHTVSA